jgi:hypothetical protein
MGIFCYFSTHSLILLIKVHISLDDDETSSNLNKPICAHYQNCYLQDEKLTLFIFLHPHAEETHFAKLTKERRQGTWELQEDMPICLNQRQRPDQSPVHQRVY